jgi:hypothetical protein
MAELHTWMVVAYVLPRVSFSKLKRKYGTCSPTPSACRVEAKVGESDAEG